MSFFMMAIERIIHKTVIEVISIKLREEATVDISHSRENRAILFRRVFSNVLKAYNGYFYSELPNINN